jgi:hypothetical protein
MALNRKNIAKAREVLFEGQLFKPQRGECLVDYFSQTDHLNAGEGLPKFHAYERMPNSQLMLTDPAAQVLRHLHYAYYINLSRLPGLIVAIAPFFWGRSLRKDAFSSISTLGTRFTRLHLIDRYLARIDFANFTAICNEYGNPIL